MSLQTLPSFSRKCSLGDAEKYCSSYSRILHNSLASKHCLVINPSRELSFTLLKTKFCSDLSLHNRTNETVLFRIRTTAAKYYIVAPTCGIIPPRDKKSIQIFMHTREHLVDRTDDKFLIQAFIYNGDDLKSDKPRSVNEIFELYSRSMSSKHFYNTKLRVHFEVNSPIRQETGDEWVFSNRAKLTKGYSIPEASKSAVTTMSEIEKENQDPNSSRRQSSVKNQWPDFKSPLYGPDHSYVDLRDLVYQKYDEIKQIKAQKKIPPVLYGSRTQTADTNLAKEETRSSLYNARDIPDKDEETVYADVSDAKSEENSIQMMGKYQAKFKGLEYKYKQQKELLARINEETEKYRTELNKLRIISSYQNNGDGKSRARSGNLTVEVWQILLVSITFLILGSLMR